MQNMYLQCINNGIMSLLHQAMELDFWVSESDSQIVPTIS